MPSKKRSSSENFHDEEQLHCREKQSRRERKALDEDEDGEREEQVQGDDEEDEDEQQDVDVDEDDEDSDESDGDPQDSPEYIEVMLPNIRKDVQCPICLGIIKKTRTVMECLHRFCRECIDKSMRLGNNECPACRTHCASRRSLRDDPRFDAVISCFYPDIVKYEEEEQAFHEDEKTRNKQIQDSIAQISQRQSEALVKRRRKGKEQTTPKSRPIRNSQSPYLKRKRSSGTTTEVNGSDNSGEENENGNTTKDYCSTEEEEPKTKHMEGKRYVRTTRNTNSDAAGAENEGTGHGNNMEGLAWGRGGARSNARHGSGSGGSKDPRSSTRLSKLADYLQTLQDNGSESVGHKRSERAEEEEEDGEKIESVDEISKQNEGEDQTNNTTTTTNLIPEIDLDPSSDKCEKEAKESLHGLKSIITSNSSRSEGKEEKDSRETTNSVDSLCECI